MCATPEPAAQLSLHAPVGDLTVSEVAGAIVALDWGWASRQSPTALLEEARRQLDAYFDAALTRFELPLAPAGSAFQRRVWQAMLAIPYGETVSYGALARQVGGVARAVGAACGRNPIPIVVPCHRVVAADGRLGGYSGGHGSVTKAALLRLESAQALLPLEAAR